MTTSTTPPIFDPDSGPRYRDLMAQARRANQTCAQQERATGRTPREDGDVSAALRAALTLLAEGIDATDWLRIGLGLDLIQRGEVRVRAAPPVAPGISIGVFDPPAGARFQRLLEQAR